MVEKENTPVSDIPICDGDSERGRPPHTALVFGRKSTKASISVTVEVVSESGNPKSGVIDVNSNVVPGLIWVDEVGREGVVDVGPELVTRGGGGLDGG